MLNWVIIKKNTETEMNFQYQKIKIKQIRNRNVILMQSKWLFRALLKIKNDILTKTRLNRSTVNVHFRTKDCNYFVPVHNF